MSRLALFACILPLSAVAAFWADKPAGPAVVGKDALLTPMVSGMKNPESVCVGVDGRVFVTSIGEFGKDGDGAVLVLEDGKARPFATGLDDPKGIVAWKQFLFVTDRNRVWKVEPSGKATVHVPTGAFPGAPKFLNDIDADTNGFLYVSDSGDNTGKDGAIFRITPSGKVSLLTSQSKSPLIRSPNGLRLLEEYHLTVVDFTSGDLLQVNLGSGKVTRLVEGTFKGGDGVTYDYFGRLYVTSWTEGTVHVIPRPGMAPVLLASGFQSAADLCLARDGKTLLVPDMKAGTLTHVPTTVPGREVDDRPLPVTLEPAFDKVEWTGWQGVTDSGKIVPQRPILLTHAGGGRGRVVMATQHGVIHSFENHDRPQKSHVFLDLQDRVKYDDNTNEEGFLGLAYHPKFETNGEFFVFYTPKKQKMVNVVSRFKVSKDDPRRGDPGSEEVLLTFKKPFWNHDGGTITFGPDGYLYITHGDGGAANDPFGNAQNLKSILGKVLRIDIDKRDEGLPYAIPRDNPFVGRKDARGEIWAYGLRNIWRMAFDRKTGKLWAGDVGQNLWEEIDLIERGGNYGWNPREGLHPFGFKGVAPNKGMIEPIWEYHHDIGKSITGGLVYRGSRVGALEGLYLYADYVSGNVWALRYDEKQKRVTANHLLRQGGFPIYSFGEDDRGEAYVLTSTPTGKGIFRFASKGK